MHTTISEDARAGARPRLTVIGTGYLGAVHAASMAALGYEVLGVDVDRAKIDALRRGEPPFYEPGFERTLREGLASGRLRFTTSFEEAASFGDVHFVCVGTPQSADSGAANLTYVESAFDELARRARRRALIVGKSTVPVGTAARLARRVAAASPAGAALELAWNPEFLREGFAVQDTLHPDRLVFGTRSAWALAMLEATFRPMLDAGTPVVRTNWETAELVKVAANSFLATKISFINAMAEVCERAGGDVVRLAEALGRDPRIGPRFLRPGLGFGGGCLPKDIRAFRARAEELGVGEALGFLDQVDRVNERARVRAVRAVRDLVGGDLHGARVAALGAAFKPNSDDVRDSPALAVADQLARAGARVAVYDPQAVANARRAHPDLGYAPTLGDALAGADAVILLTEWDEFASADPAALGALVAARRVLDTRQALDPAAYRAAGWTYRALGRPSDVAPAEDRVATPALGAGPR